MDHIFKVHWFHHKGIGAQTICLIHIADGFGTGKHNYSQSCQILLVTDPFQHLESVHARHFQIQQHQFRQRVFRSIGIFPGALQIRDRFFPISHNVQGIWDVGFAKSLENESDVVFPILRQ